MLLQSVLNLRAKPYIWLKRAHPGLTYEGHSSGTPYISGTVCSSASGYGICAKR